MAKRRSSKSTKQLVSTKIVGWYFDRLTSLAHRFSGTALELGREGLPQQRHDETLLSLGLLVSDFSILFPPELFNDPELHAEWRHVRTVAEACQQNLIDQFRRLGELTPEDDAAEYDLRYKTASSVLAPFANELRKAMLDI